MTKRTDTIEEERGIGKQTLGGVVKNLEPKCSERVLWEKRGKEEVGVGPINPRNKIE